MRFGTLSFTRAPFGELVERGRWFEQLGFDSAWVDDDLIAEPGLSDFEAWAPLGALARETSRMRIGTLVSTIPFRHPTFLAAQAITVDYPSGGRVSVGLGSGACCPEFNPLLGHGEWSPAERADRFGRERRTDRDRCHRVVRSFNRPCRDRTPRGARVSEPRGEAVGMNHG